MGLVCWSWDGAPTSRGLAWALCTSWVSSCYVPALALPKELLSCGHQQTEPLRNSVKLGALSNANPLGFDSLGKWVEAFIEHLSAGSIALSGPGGGFQLLCLCPKNTEPGAGPPLCLYLLTLQLDFIRLMSQALVQDSTGVAQPVLSSWCRTSAECPV